MFFERIFKKKTKTLKGYRQHFQIQPKAVNE
jgi:hypothetical protein